MLMCGACLIVMAKGIDTLAPINVEMAINPIKTGGVGNQNPRSPIEVPSVFQIDHTLYIYGVDGDYILQLETADGVAYTLPILGSTGSDTVVLPSSLSGSYELCIYASVVILICK